MGGQLSVVTLNPHQHEAGRAGAPALSTASVESMSPAGALCEDVPSPRSEEHGCPGQRAPAALLQRHPPFPVPWPKPGFHGCQGTPFLIKSRLAGQEGLKLGPADHLGQSTPLLASVYSSVR